MKQQNRGVPGPISELQNGVAGRWYTKRSNIGVPAARMSEKGLLWEQVQHETAESWGT